MLITCYIARQEGGARELVGRSVVGHFVDGFEKKVCTTRNEWIPRKRSLSRFESNLLLRFPMPIVDIKYPDASV
jgi:hypothetical protein